MAAGVSVNSGILHGTPNTDDTEGTALPLLANDNYDNINEVDIQENDPAEIIDVNTDNKTDGEKEYPTYENPGDNPSENQDGVSNTAYYTAAKYSEDTTKNRAAGDNPEGSIKVEDVDNEDDINISDDDVENVMGVDESRGGTS